MKDYAWSFLISCNERFDYRMIVAPDFIVREGLTDWIMRYIRISGIEESVNQEMFHDKVGDIMLIYHVQPAVHKGQIFEDKLGRQINWIEGIVMKGKGKTLTSRNKIFSDIHEILEKEYIEFWNTVTNPVQKISKSFEVEIEIHQNSGNESINKMGEREYLPRIKPRKRFQLSFVMLMAAAVFGILVIVEIIKGVNDRDSSASSVVFDISREIKKGTLGPKFPNKEIISSAAYTVSAVAVKDEINLPRHADMEHVLYIFSGQGTVTRGTTTTVLLPGMIVHVPKGVAHSLKAGRGGLVLVDFAQPRFEPNQMERAK